MPEFTHVTEDKVRMVDISEKGTVYREATAKGRIHLRKDTLDAIIEGRSLKGNVLATARVAATLAIKDTPRIIPMCHSIAIDGITIDFETGADFIEAKAKVVSCGKTGVEMEALTGVSAALLTIWDMVKSAEKDEAGQYPVTSIENIHVTEKKRIEL